MTINPNLAARLYRLDQQLRGRGEIFKRLEFLERSQYDSPEQIRQNQLEKLANVIRHAAKTVPYYKRVFAENGLDPDRLDLPGDLKKIPLLTRPVLLKHNDELLSEAADRRSLQVNHSSGSTGVRAKFTQDENFRLWMRAHQLRTYQWCAGWKIGEPFLLLWGSEIYWKLKTFRDSFSNFASNRREFNTFYLSKKLIADFTERIVRFRPTLISTYPNAMHLIAQYAEEKNIVVPDLRCIQSTSEPLTPEMRERLLRVFNCKVYDKYGSRETNVVYHESPNHEGMCIQAENVFVEILDEAGNDCRPGQNGRIVLTTLNNASMPLIRYETQDLSHFIDGVCSSGINLPRMAAVHGRLQDLIQTPDGGFIDSYFFSYLFMRFHEIAWFQVIQNEPDRLLVNIYAPGGLSGATIAELKERMKHHTNFDFRPEFNLLDEMPQSATGKFRLCVNNLRTRSEAQ